MRSICSAGTTLRDREHERTPGIAGVILVTMARYIAVSCSHMGSPLFVTNVLRNDRIEQFVGELQARGLRVSSRFRLLRLPERRVLAPTSRWSDYAPTEDSILVELETEDDCAMHDAPHSSGEVPRKRGRLQAMGNSSTDSSPHNKRHRSSVQGMEHGGAVDVSGGIILGSPGEHSDSSVRCV